MCLGMHELSSRHGVVDKMLVVDNGSFGEHQCLGHEVIGSLRLSTDC